MNIYKVCRTDHVDWEEYSGMVVVAESPERALELILYTSYATEWGVRKNEDGSYDSRVKDHVVVTDVELNTERVILTSFRDG